MESPWSSESDVVLPETFVLKGIQLINGVKYFYTSQITGIMETLDLYYHIKPSCSKYEMHKMLKDGIGKVFDYVNQLDRCRRLYY
jgi:hypothetical protein